MKKSLLLSVLLLLTLSLVGCSSKTDTNKEKIIPKSETKKIITKDINYFKSEVTKVVDGYKEDSAYYQMVGAEDGFKVLNSREEIVAEIYVFDKKSEDYINAEKQQKLCLYGENCFLAVIKNGYALVTDDERYQEKIINIFNQLN